MKCSVGRGVLVVCAALCLATSVYAQGGGASSTGVIQGRVSDEQGGVLPGVTVTATSPALMGAQTQVTSETGNYRFPAVPPGVYTVTFELPGFTTVKREGINISLGFTASLNIELGVATLQETVTVTGDSPVIDTTATRVQQNFKLEQLESLPSARDMWGVLAVTPGVQMTRTDVGGNRAGSQTGYTAYGFTGQARVLVEGINTTEGTDGAGFYFDYGSFEEVFIGTAGNSAEMPHPGVQSQFLGKSGGNNFQGQFYIDYSNSSLQGSNIDAEQRGMGVRDHSNEMEGYRDLNINLGGPIKQDKLWWYFSYRDQKNEITNSQFLFDKLFETRLWNPSVKSTYQMSQNHKLIGYYQYGQKIQPNRTFDATYLFPSEESTRNQDSGSWVWKGEWNGTLSNSLYVEARYGVFGYYFPLVGYSNEPWRQDSGTQIATGGDQVQQLDRDRKQLTGAATYFKDNFLGGTHSVKFGGEMNLETGYEGFESIRAGNLRHYFNNGTPTQVDIGFSTVDGSIGEGAMGISNQLLSVGKLDHYNAFVSDQWGLGRLTLNVGVRWDRYQSSVPEQRQSAQTTAGFSIPERLYASQTFFTWNSFVPRVGLVFDLFGSGKTVVKANYGFFRHNPGIATATDANPNQALKYLRYQWNDANGDRLFQNGEEGNLIQSALEGGQTVDPNIKQPYTHEVSGFLEHQLSDTLGVRVGYVYKTNDDRFQLYTPGRPIDAYTQPFDFLDIGVDGVRGTSDDRTIPLLGIPQSQLASLPATRVLQTTPAEGRFNTIEGSVNKRMSQKWSLGVGWAYTRSKEHATAIRGNTISPSRFPNTPNDTSLIEYNSFGFNAFGSYEAPYGIRFSPVLRYTRGSEFGRTVVVANANPFYNGTILVEDVGTRKMEDIAVLDMKTEKLISLGAIRLRGFLDIFNILNTNPADTMSFATGVSFLRPTAIVGPRTLRIGARVEW